MNPRIFLFQIREKLFIAGGVGAVFEPAQRKGGGKDTAGNDRERQVKSKRCRHDRLSSFVWVETNDELDRGQWDVLSLKKGGCEEGLVVFWEPGLWVLSVVAFLPTGA